MELSNSIALTSGIVGLLNLAAAVSPGIVAYKQLRETSSQKSRIPKLNRTYSLVTSVLLASAAFVLISFGGWVFHTNPLDPAIKTIIVDRIVNKPCPITQQMNGPATARGNGSFAHSGNGDTYNQAPPSASGAKKSPQ